MSLPKSLIIGRFTLISKLTTLSTLLKLVKENLLFRTCVRGNICRCDVLLMSKNMLGMSEKKYVEFVK